MLYLSSVPTGCDLCYTRAKSSAIPTKCPHRVWLMLYKGQEQCYTHQVSPQGVAYVIPGLRAVLYLPSVPTGCDLCYTRAKSSAIPIKCPHRVWLMLYQG